MRHVQKLFFVPVGLPGMGKSTLAKNIRLSIENNLSCNRQNTGATGQQSKPPPQTSNRTTFEPRSANTDATSRKASLSASVDPSLLSLYGGQLPTVDFKKISYDRILGDQTNAYLE